MMAFSSMWKGEIWQWEEGGCLDQFFNVKIQGHMNRMLFDDNVGMLDASCLFSTPICYIFRKISARQPGIEFFDAESV